MGEKKCFGRSIDARGASLQLQEEIVEKMRRFEREGSMGIVALSGARVYCMRELVHNAEALSRVMRCRRGRQKYGICVMATVYPTVYPNDMPPILARQEPSYKYIRPFCCIWYLTLLIFRVLCILVFWEPYPICMIHWINKLYRRERHTRHDPSS